MAARGHDLPEYLVAIGMPSVRRVQDKLYPTENRWVERRRSKGHSLFGVKGVQFAAHLRNSFSKSTSRWLERGTLTAVPTRPLNAGEAAWHEKQVGRGRS